ncbi:unnamed protein product [Symbiodinium sp. CCMP2456]|nr:unnamed protein product [Symbiodinium sp. CCMP2456]
MCAIDHGSLSDRGGSAIRLAPSTDICCAGLWLPAYIAELSQLTDSVAPFPREAADRTLRKEWQSTRSQRSALAAVQAAGLPENPRAAASLGQVYCLNIPGHGPVAVKIQRLVALQFSEFPPVHRMFGWPPPLGEGVQTRVKNCLVSQTGRQLMRKGSFSGLGDPIGIPPVTLKPSLGTPGPGLQKSASDSVILPPLKAGTGRPSTVARRENRRRQMLAEQMMERTERSENVAETGLVTDRLDSFEVLSEAFGHDVRGVTDRLEDMARSIRFENWRSKTEERERKRREEEKRLQEEEKRKVALRIENRRRFDGDNEKAASIPMHPVEAGQGGGKDERLQKRICMFWGSGIKPKERRYPTGPQA